MDRFTRLIATFFGVGYCPVWPGAAGSAAGIVIAWYASPSLLLILLGAFTFLGFWACAPSERVYATHDPQKFVMDEVCGMFISILFLPKTMAVYAAGYILFRIFDSIKPWPISLIQKNKHPHSIMWDDLAAGVISNVCLQAWFLVAGLR